MTLKTATSQNTYTVIDVTTDEKVKKFLKTLGVFEGQLITLISKSSTNYILNVKDSRYAIDTFLASKIKIANA